MTDVANGIGSRTPRGWLRFSVRALLVALTLIGISLGARVNLARRQREAVRAIQAAHGDVVYADVKSSGMKDRRPPTLSWLDQQVGIDFFHSVHEVGLRGDDVSDKTLIEVGKLRSLRQLWIEGSRVTDDGLTHIERLSQLEVVGLLGTQISDSGLAHLTSLPHLKNLDLAGSPITDEGLELIANIRGLESLHLMGKEITDEGMKHVAQIDSLRELQLHETSVTDNGIASLVNLSNLECLKLPEAVTDAGCEHLAQMKRLKVVFSAKMRLSPQAQAELSTAVPGIKLH